MIGMLSPEEIFSDHLEIVSYLTVAACGIFSLVYFGMIFFYRPVQLEDPVVKAGLLIGSLLMFGLAFLLPARKNFARILFRWFFLGMAVYAYFHSLERGQWWFLLALVFSIYSGWVLAHPGVAGFSRKLRPAEERLREGGGGLVFHQGILMTAAAVMTVRGLQALVVPSDDPASNPETGSMQLLAAFLVTFLVFFTRRLHAWARYTLAAFLGLAMLAGIPDTMTGRVENYLEYWKALIWVGYCGVASGVFFFSPGLNRVFKKIPPATTPAGTADA